MNSLLYKPFLNPFNNKCMNMINPKANYIIYKLIIRNFLMTLERSLCIHANKHILACYNVAYYSRCRGQGIHEMWLNSQSSGMLLYIYFIPIGNCLPKWISLTQFSIYFNTVNAKYSKQCIANINGK